MGTIIVPLPYNIQWCTVPIYVRCDVMKFLDSFDLRIRVNRKMYDRNERKLKKHMCKKIQK